MGYHPVTGPSWYRYGGGRRSSDRLKSSSWADSLSRFKDEHGHIAPVLRPSSICIAARDVVCSGRSIRTCNNERQKKERDRG